MNTQDSLLGLRTHIKRTLLGFLWHILLPLDKSNVFRRLVSLLLLFMHDEGLLMNFHCKDRMCFLHPHNKFCPPGEFSEQILKIILPCRNVHQVQHTLTWPMVILLTSTQLFIFLNSSVFWLITAECLPRFSLQYALQPAKLTLFLEMNEDVKSNKTWTSEVKSANWANIVENCRRNNKLWKHDNQSQVK